MLIGPDPVPPPGSLGIFADEGESVHAALYRHVAHALGRAGVEVLLYLPRGGRGVLLDALRKEVGARLTVVSCSPVTGMEGATLVLAENLEEARAEVARRAWALIGMPAGLGPVADLYRSWAAARDAGAPLPVGLLNHKKAFEVVRGFFSDVAAVGLERTDHLVQIAETIDDLIARLARAAQNTGA